MLTIYQIHTNPASGGDTLWASAYEAYSRISPPIAQLLEGLNAVHDAHWFKQAARGFGFDMRTGERGSPLNKGDELQAIHPVIRVSEYCLGLVVGPPLTLADPVTGWKGLFINKEFTTRILGVSRDESDMLLDYLVKIVTNNHDLQVRFKWSINNAPGIGDVAIWDNRSTFHSVSGRHSTPVRSADYVLRLRMTTRSSSELATELCPLESDRTMIRPGRTGERRGDSRSTRFREQMRGIL